MSFANNRVLNKLICSHNLKPTNRKGNWRAVTENKHQSQIGQRARWKSFCCLHPSLTLALPPAQQPWQSLVMSPRLVEALLPCPTQGYVWRSPGACLVKSLMFYSRASREEKSTQWLPIHFAADKTAILCSNKNSSRKRWIGSALLWARQSPQISVREMSPPQCYPQACYASVSVSVSKSAPVSQASLVVLRWSQSRYRETSWFWFQSSCRKARPFSMSPLRWGKKLSCFTEKISSHHIELLKVRKTVRL